MKDLILILALSNIQHWKHPEFQPQRPVQMEQYWDLDASDWDWTHVA